MLHNSLNSLHCTLNIRTAYPKALGIVTVAPQSSDHSTAPKVHLLISVNTRARAARVR
jgi:hypothetical protein